MRPAFPSEYEQVGELCVRAYSTGGHLHDGDPYADVLRDVESRAQAGSVLVHAIDSVVVATVTVCPLDTPFAEVGRAGEFEFRFLAVDPTLWGTGLGPGVVGACAELARTQGCQRMVICVIDVNEQARRMYERLGFTRQPDRDWSPATGVDLLAYGYEL